MKNLFYSFLFISMTFSWLTMIGQVNDFTNKKNPASGFPLELSIVQNSDAPHSDEVHTYRLKITNKSSKEIQLKILADNVACAVDKKINVPFQHKIFWTAEELRSGIDGAGSISVDANNSIEFYISLISPKNAVLNSWNCTSVKITGMDNKILSDNIILESYIPDPKNFR